MHLICLSACSTTVQKRLEQAGEALLGVTDEEKASTTIIINTAGQEAAEVAEEAQKTKKAAIVDNAGRVQKEIRRAGRKVKQKLCERRVGLEYKKVPCEP